MYKECRKAYDARRYQDNKNAIKQRNNKYRSSLEEYDRKLKTETPCTDCGKRFHYAIMQWDHLPEYDKVTAPVNLAHQGSKSAYEAEIAKCELVCANCHCMRTFNRRGAVAELVNALA